MEWLLLKRFSRFTAIAAVAFCIDFSTLYVFSSMLGLTLLEARLVSMSMASTAAWYGNRVTTFADRAWRRKGPQWFRYLSVIGISSIFNYGIYAIVVSLSSWMAKHPPAAIAPGALCAMLINFACVNLWVFPDDRSD